MAATGRARRVMVFVNETDQWHHRPVFTEIVHRAQQLGMAGATVLRGLEGFGASHHVHTTRILSLSEDLPVVVVVVDNVSRVDALLVELDEVVREGLVVVDDVDVVQYAEGQPGDQP